MPFDGPEEKYADTLASVDPLFRERWSPRSFLPRDVSGQDLETMLEAARWAASSGNEQPWRFIVARKSEDENFKRILGLLEPSNQAWAAAAPVLIVMACSLKFGRNGQPNGYALHDTGAALAHLMLQATALGLHAHGMAGFDHERARVELSIPEEYGLGAAVALGYRGSPDQLSPQNRQRELARRERKPLSELVFGGRWDRPLAL